MKTEFKISAKEVIKETAIAFITYMVMSCIACAIAWPIIKWNDKRRKEKEEKEETPSPESFSDVKRAEDVRFTDEEDDDDRPINQNEDEDLIFLSRVDDAE